MPSGLLFAYCRQHRSRRQADDLMLFHKRHPRAGSRQGGEGQISQSSIGDNPQASASEALGHRCEQLRTERSCGLRKLLAGRAEAPLPLCQGLIAVLIGSLIARVQRRVSTASQHLHRGAAGKRESLAIRPGDKPRIALFFAQPEFHQPCFRIRQQPLNSRKG